MDNPVLLRRRRRWSTASPALLLTARAARPDDTGGRRSVVGAVAIVAGGGLLGGWRSRRRCWPWPRLLLFLEPCIPRGRTRRHRPAPADGVRGAGRRSDSAAVRRCSPVPGTSLFLPRGGLPGLTGDPSIGLVSGSLCPASSPARCSASAWRPPSSSGPFLGTWSWTPSGSCSRKLLVRNELGRIASELHDIVGHALSVMVVQAAAGQRLVDRSPEDARVPRSR